MGALLTLSAIAAALVVHAAPKSPASVYDFKEKDIDGKSVSLNKFKGQVLLIVNTASY